MVVIGIEINAQAWLKGWSAIEKVKWMSRNSQMRNNEAWNLFQMLEQLTLLLSTQSIQCWHCFFSLVLGTIFCLHDNPWIVYGAMCIEEETNARKLSEERKMSNISAFVNNLMWCVHVYGNLIAFNSTFIQKLGAASNLTNFVLLNRLIQWHCSTLENVCDG